MGANSATGVGLGAADIVSRGINLKKYVGNTLHPFLISQATDQVDEQLTDLTWIRIKFQETQSIINNDLSIDEDGIISIPPGYWAINAKVCTRHSGSDFVTLLATHIYNEDLNQEVLYTYNLYSYIASGNLPMTSLINNIVLNQSNDVMRISIRILVNSTSEDADIRFGYPSDVVIEGTNHAGTINISRVGSYGI